MACHMADHRNMTSVKTYELGTTLYLLSPNGSTLENNIISPLNAMLTLLIFYPFFKNINDA